MKLRIEGINKSFGSSRILKDVSFEIEKGEIMSLAGESGCGKSTLLRIISGLEKQDSGNIFLDNIEISKWTPEKRRFGFVFQNLSLFPHLSVKENIFFGLKRKDQTRNKLQELISLTGLSGMESRYPHQLSGGQQQRVALARALAINPELLILDEPFSSLDELLKAKIREEIFDLLKSLQITTILVSHQASDAFLIADKLVMLKDGAIIQSGKPAEIYNNPSSAYISDFFGASVIISGEKRESQKEIATAFGSLHVNTPSNGKLQLFIRPEQVRISDSYDFNISGKIIRKDFKGPHDVISVGSLDSREQFTLETERCELNVGDTIFLKLPEEHIQVFQ